MAIETVEGYDEGADGKDEALEIIGRYYWKGRLLAPFSMGYKVVWLSIAADNDRPRFMAASLVWFLLRLQQAYELASERKQGEDSAWREAGMAMLMTCERRIEARYEVMTFISDEADRDEDILALNKLATAISMRADSSEPEAPAPDQAQEALSKHTGKQKRKSPRKR